MPAQWFLHTFAKIPNPRFFAAPYTWNHAAGGIFLPSIIPFINLPGRVMDNVKFHIAALFLSGGVAVLGWL